MSFHCSTSAASTLKRLSFENKSAGREVNLDRNVTHVLDSCPTWSHGLAKRAIFCFIFYLLGFCVLLASTVNSVSKNTRINGLHLLLHLQPSLATVATASAGLWVHSAVFAAVPRSFSRQMEQISTHLPSVFTASFSLASA